MPTLLIPDRKSNPDIEALHHAARAMDWAVLPVRYRLPEGPKPTTPVLYGDPLFCDIVAAQAEARLLEPPNDLLVRLDPFWTRRTISLSTLVAARKDISRPTFVKSAIDKSIPATVYASGADLPTEEIAPGETPVLLSEPVRWAREWRLFVRNGRILAHSPYFRDGKLDFTQEPGEAETMLGYAERLISELTDTILPPSVVVDVGHLDSGLWAMVEANPSWASGLYKCSPEAALWVIGGGTVSAESASPFLRPTAILEAES